MINDKIKRFDWIIKKEGTLEYLPRNAAIRY